MCIRDRRSSVTSISAAETLEVLVRQRLCRPAPEQVGPAPPSTVAVTAASAPMSEVAKRPKQPPVAKANPRQSLTLAPAHKTRKCRRTASYDNEASQPATTILVVDPDEPNLSTFANHADPAIDTDSPTVRHSQVANKGRVNKSRIVQSRALARRELSLLSRLLVPSVTAPSVTLNPWLLLISHSQNHCAFMRKKGILP